MAMNGTNSYGAAPAYGNSPYGGGQTSPASSNDPGALSQSIDYQLKAYAARGAVPTAMPNAGPAVQSASPLSSAPRVAAANAPNAANTDPAQQGNVSWALLMEMKRSSGDMLTTDEQSRYDAIMARANGGAAPAGGPATAPTAAGTDPGQQGNVTWALLIEMKRSSGQGLTPSEQARYDGIMTRANQGQPAPGPAGPSGQPTGPSAPSQGQVNMPSELPGPPPATPAATAAQPMTQPEYDVEVKWALTFEKSAEAVRYNAFNKEKKIRNGTAEGQPAMDDQKFTTEAAWAQAFSQTPDIARYKRIAGEVQRRKAAGEKTKPSGILDKVKSFFSGLIAKFTGKSKTQPAAQPAAQSGNVPANGQQAPAPTSR